MTFAGGDGNLQFPTSGSANRGYVAVSSSATATPIGSNTATWGVTIACWVTRQSAVEPNIGYVFGWASDTATFAEFTVGSPSSGGAGYAPQVLNSVNGFGLDPTGTPTYADGKPHLIVATATVGGGNITLTIYVDGVQTITGTSTLVAALGSATPDMRMYRPVVSGDFTQNVASAGAQGTYAHFPAWNRVLSASEITDLWNAGGLGNAGEMSGTRVGRYLANYFTGPSVVDSRTLSLMGPATAPESTPLLQALQRVQDTEMGNLFENRDGAVQFDGRDQRWQRLAPTVVFGENTAGGEIPYEESPVFGNPLTQVNNQALITRSGGIRAVGRPDTTGSINSFYPRGYTLQVDCQTDTEAQQHADWMVLTRSQPRQRVATITINLGANPAAFPTLMNLDIGTRCTVKRRPKAANSGAGITMSQDYFVEKITHRQIDPEQGTWFVDLEMSPVPTPQPWICGDATYGVVGQTTIPGF